MSKSTDAQLAERLLRTADDLDAMDLVETAASLRDAAERLKRVDAAKRTTIEAICHDEQLEIWSQELAEHLNASGHVPLFGSYDDKLAFFDSLKAGIKDCVETALDDHPELMAEIARVQDWNNRLGDALMTILESPTSRCAFVNATAALEEWRKARVGESNEEQKKDDTK